MRSARCCANAGSLAAQRQQIAVQRAAPAASRLARESSLQRVERRRASPGRRSAPAPPASPAAETARRNSPRPSRTSRRQLGVVIGEVEERRERAELLALEQHRRARRRAAAAPSSRAAGRATVSAWQARAARRVRDLIVVLEVEHERRRPAGPAPACRARCFCQGSTAPDTGSPHLSAEISSCGRAAVVAVVGLVASGQRHARVWWKSSFHSRRGRSRRSLGGRDEARVLRLVLGDDQRSRAAPAAARTRRPIAARMCSGDVVEDRLRRVEAQAVEVELVDPVAGVGDEELAHRAAIAGRRSSAPRPTRCCAVA